MIHKTNTAEYVFTFTDVQPNMYLLFHKNSQFYSWMEFCNFILLLKMTLKGRVKIIYKEKEQLNETQAHT